MVPSARNIFPYAVILIAFGALAWAVSFGTLPKADFSFNNGDEVKTVDPPKATGAPEGRIIDALFEGLYRNHPKGYELGENGELLHSPESTVDGNFPLENIPATAESCDISDDGTIYRFKIRDTARWSDGTPVTADDFVWSWRRMLHPETASRYAYQLYYVVGAKQYNEARVEVDERVEVELADRSNPQQPFPRGSIRRGTLRQIVKPPEPTIPESVDDEQKQQAKADWRKRWVYVVEVRDAVNGSIDWDAPGTITAFSKAAPGEHAELPADVPSPVTKCLHVLSDFDSQVGVRIDQADLVVTLNNRTPFFLDLVAFYPLYPVNRRCVEQYGVPHWTKAENIVSNGPFMLQFRRIRDRVRLIKNPQYWNASTVRLEVIDALAIKSETTSLNMYLNGQIEWATTVPTTIVPELQKRDDFISAPALITYFYRLNVNRPPLDDVHVRRALNLAIDKQLICEKVTKAGQRPARHFVPPGLADYQSPIGGEYSKQAARDELARSSYARSGKPIPKVQILYNTNEGHRSIAEVIQQQWKNNLGIDVELKNSEWATFLDGVHTMDYVVARAGWIGDYADPNTFLDMWVTGGENNETGWSNAKYDGLIRDAQSEPDPLERLELLAEAESILMDEMPVLPIYFYVSVNMVNPRVVGFYANIQDVHPLHLLRYKRD